MGPLSLALALLVGVVSPGPSSAQTDRILAERIETLRQDRTLPVPVGTLTGIEYHLDIARRIERRFPERSVAWRARAVRFLEAAEAGHDPYQAGQGQLLTRAYEPSFSPARQGYSIYLPPNYDPTRSYPLMITLHGGSSNGNLFLGVVLGNNMDWLTYNQHLWDDYSPRWTPDWIVVAPDGVGQLIWRFMGEQDVLEVLDDVQQHYSVDPNRVVLAGLSNGGMGAYSIGTRHAWRFSHVQAIAGAPSWLQYAGGRPTDDERVALTRYSAVNLIENTLNTDFRNYHGTLDGGPMRPAFVRQLTAQMNRLGMEPRVRWYEHGHDLLYMVHRHGRIYERLSTIVRDPRPAQVRLVTGDYRANRQHWLSVTRFARYPELAHLQASASDGQITLETDNTLELSLDLRTAPTGDGAQLRIEADGQEVYHGPRAHLAHAVHLYRDGEEGAWALGFLPPAEGLEKVAGLAGPMTDAYHDEIIHVYGTQDASSTESLRRTAARGANGWPGGVWYLNQRVVADSEVTDEMMRSAHLALYGTAASNSVLRDLGDTLPIVVEGDSLVMGSERFTGRDIGARFIYPNPRSPGRYVLVHTGVSADAIGRTRNLPDFLPDYVIYDRRTTASRPRLIAGRNRQLAAGYFDRFWRLPSASAESASLEAGGTAAEPGTGVSETGVGETEIAETEPPEPPTEAELEMRRLAEIIGAPADFVMPRAVLMQTPPATLPPGPVPDDPPRARRFLASRDDINGPIARRLARMVPSFYNFRAIIAGGRWRESRRAVFRIRPQDTCLEQLDELGVPYDLVEEDLPTPTPTPIRLAGPVGGIEYSTVRPDESIVLSCEMAARLPLLSRILRRQGVRQVAVLSSHRLRPRQSFHTAGMALDLFSFQGRSGHLSVNNDFVETPDHPTCEAPEPADPQARALLRIACDLAETGRFNSVLTPNYNDGHRNHFHIDIRPDDPRIFVR